MKRHGGIQQKGQSLQHTVLCLLFDQSLLLNKTFPVCMVFTFYWDIPAPTGVEGHKNDGICIKPRKSKLKDSQKSCHHQDPLMFSATTEKTEYHSHRETGLFACGTPHLSQTGFHECHTIINRNTKPTDSIPSGTEPCARPPTVALIVQSAEEWDHSVAFWGMACRWEQSDKASNHHGGGKKSN